MKSGEFAKLCKTTKNTLIHYDELGILKPSQRGSNRYRDYTMDDYMTFVIVHAFVQAGFPLREVGRLVREPDAAALARAVEENRGALDERRAALERSERLLGEIGRQARASLEFEPGKVRLASRDSRRLLVVREGCAMRAGDDLTGLYREDADAMEMLGRFGPEAEIAPYGMSARLDDGGEPLYDALFYELPPSARPVKGAPVETLAAGTYVEADFEGPWGDVGAAYAALAGFIDEGRLRPTGRFYEVAQMRLLDTDPARYRCRIGVAVAATGA